MELLFYNYLSKFNFYYHILTHVSISSYPKFIVVQSLSHVWLFATLWTAVCQAFLSFTISWILLKFMSIEWVMLSNHLILYPLILLLPSVSPNIRVFSSESPFHICWPKCWGFRLSISPSNEYSRLIFFRMDGWISLLSKESSPTLQFKNFNSLALSFLYIPTITSIHDYRENHSFD